MYYKEAPPSKGKYILRPVDPENIESVLKFVEPVELPTEGEVVDMFQIHASEQIFSHQLMTQNDFKEAITNLLKGER